MRVYITITTGVRVRMRVIMDSRIYLGAAGVGHI